MPSLGSRRRPRGLRDYHYRVGLVDLDANLPELKAVAKGLNQVQAVFYLKPSRQAPSRRALTRIEGEKQLDIDRLSSRFYDKIAPPDADHVICLTDRFLTFETSDGSIRFNYLGANSRQVDRIKYASIAALDEYAEEADVSYEVALSFAIVTSLSWHFFDIPYHKTTRGCPMDFTDVHSKLVKGIQKGAFCKQCLVELKKYPKLRRAVTSMLNWGR